MTEGILSTVEDFTGYRPLACPWKAFFDPFVSRVLAAYRFFESGQLLWAEPRASHRLVEGVSFYHATDNGIFAKQMRMDREERRRNG